MIVTGDYIRIIRQLFYHLETRIENDSQKPSSCKPGNCLDKKISTLPIEIDGNSSILKYVIDRINILFSDDSFWMLGNCFNVKILFPETTQHWILREAPNLKI